MTDDRIGQVAATVEEWPAIVSSQFALIDRAFMEQAIDGDDYEARIAGWITSIAYVRTALQSLPGFSADMTPFIDLMLRLDELAQGRNPFPPPKREGKGRPPEGFRHAIMQGRAAAALELLISKGESSRDAEKFVAKHLARAGVVGRQGAAVTGATVREWRSKVKDATAFCEKPDARSIYLHMLANMRQLGPADMPLGDLKRVLAHLICPQASPAGRVLHSWGSG